MKKVRVDGGELLHSKILLFWLTSSARDSKRLEVARLNGRKVRARPFSSVVYILNSWIWAKGALREAKQGTNTKRWDIKLITWWKHVPDTIELVFFTFFLEFLDESFKIFYVKISQIKCTKTGTPFSKFCINF